MARISTAQLLVDLPANVDAGVDGGGAPTRGDQLRTAFTARFLAAFLHRAASAAKGIPLMPLLLKQLNQFLTGADISPQAVIAPGVVFYHPNGVVIGSGARIGRDVIFQQGVTVGGLGGPRRHAVPTTVIGDRVFLGAGSRIIGAVVVGEDAIVGANAVVTRDVPVNSIATGVPARSRSRASSPANAERDQGEPLS